MKNAETTPNGNEYNYKVYAQLKSKYNGDTHPVGNGEEIAHYFSPKSTHDYYWLCTNLEKIGLGHRLSPDGTVTVIWP